MSDELSSDEQDNLVGELAEGIESLSDEEFDERYEQLDADHKMEVDQRVRAFADNAVGDEHWDSDQ